MSILCSKLATILFMILVTSFFTSSLSKPCRDDPIYTFGRYTWINDQGDEVETERSCSWLTKNPNNSQVRMDEWCDPSVTWRFGVRIYDKCAVTCSKCTNDQESINLKNIARVVPDPGSSAGPDSSAEDQCRDFEEWFDQGGPLFGCKWYEEIPERCAAYGYRFKNKGRVANEACCVCGGGRQDRRLDEVEAVTTSRHYHNKSFSEKKLRKRRSKEGDSDV